MRKDSLDLWWDDGSLVAVWLGFFGIEGLLVFLWHMHFIHSLWIVAVAPIVLGGAATGVGLALVVSTVIAAAPLKWWAV